MNTEQFYAHGKLLLTGEYLVLKGARALAVPTAFGQWLQVAEAAENLHWISKDVSGNVWFSASFDKHLNILETDDPAKAAFLQKLVTAALKISGKKLRPAKAETQLEFPRNWGLGSSSSLTSLIAQYFVIDPFALFFETQNGSGYDIACATSSQPLLYTLKDKQPRWQKVELPPVFKNSHFVHLNQKQQSSPEVDRFLKKKTDNKLVRKLSALTEAFLSADSEDTLKSLIRRHEEHIASAIDAQQVKEKLFPDFDGEIKSLGAWGGDFVMALGQGAKEYFGRKGYATTLGFDEMVLGGDPKELTAP